MVIVNDYMIQSLANNSEYHYLIFSGVLALYHVFVNKVTKQIRVYRELEDGFVVESELAEKLDPDNLQQSLEIHGMVDDENCLYFEFHGEDEENISDDWIDDEPDLFDIEFTIESENSIELYPLGMSEYEIEEMFESEFSDNEPTIEMGTKLV